LFEQSSWGEADWKAFQIPDLKFKIQKFQIQNIAGKRGLGIGGFRDWNTGDSERGNSFVG
jgi:hypothetical protein